MRYTAFEIKNFKGIDDLAIKVDGDVTTLIGLNESGKTTILEAIFCFSYGSEDLDFINPGLASLRDPEQWIPISKRANFNETIEICATLSLSLNDKRLLRSHMLKAFGLRLSEVPDAIKIQEQYTFTNSRSSGTNRVWGFLVHGTKGQQRNARKYDDETPEWHGAVEWLSDALPRIWYFPNFLFELPERFVLTGLDGLDAEERDRNTFYRSTFEQVLFQLGYGANLSTHVVDRLSSVERADKRSLDAVLLDMSRAITTTIFAGWNRIFGREPTAQEVEINADQENGAAYLQLQIKGPDGFYDLSERSLGFRWFFMFLLMTSYSGAVAESNDLDQRPLFLLDEPASNLHSSAQAELLKSFDGLTKRCHLIYTTHSHHLIDLRWLDSAFVIKNEALGSLGLDEYMSVRVGAKTSISATRYRTFVNENPSQTSYFQPVLDLLDYRPSNLEPVADVVLAEGKSDFYLLRYVTEVLNHDISCPPLIPGTGAGTLDTAIRLYLGWGKRFVVLLDGDSEGLQQRDRYQALFEPALRNRCVLLPELCGDPAAVEAETLLSASDRSSLINAVYPSKEGRPSEKKALSKAVLELYARNEKVSFEDATINRLRTLGEALTKSLTDVG